MGGIGATHEILEQFSCHHTHTHSAQKQQTFCFPAERYFALFHIYSLFFVSLRHFVTGTASRMYLRIQYIAKAVQPWAVHDKVVRVSLRELMACTTLHCLLEYCRHLFKPKAQVL